jgi:hypothetical protein
MTGPRGVPVLPKAEESGVAAISGCDTYPDKLVRRNELSIRVIPGEDRLEVSAVGRSKALLRRPPDHRLADTRLRRQACHPPRQ